MASPGNIQGLTSSLSLLTTTGTEPSAREQPLAMASHLSMELKGALQQTAGLTVSEPTLCRRPITYKVHGSEAPMSNFMQIDKKLFWVILVEEVSNLRVLQRSLTHCGQSGEHVAFWWPDPFVSLIDYCFCSCKPSVPVERWDLPFSSF